VSTIKGAIKIPTMIATLTKNLLDFENPLICLLSNPSSLS